MVYKSSQTEQISTHFDHFKVWTWTWTFFTLLIRRAINAVTVIPLITLLIPQAIIAVITFIINSN